MEERCVSLSLEEITGLAIIIVLNDPDSPKELKELAAELRSKYIDNLILSKDVVSPSIQLIEAVAPKLSKLSFIRMVMERYLDAFENN